MTLRQQVESEAKKIVEEIVGVSINQQPATFRAISDALELYAKKAEDAEEALKVSRMIEDSFWAARKRLNLPTVNVQDPGQDITDFIASLTHRLEAAEKERDELQKLLTKAIENTFYWQRKYEALSPKQSSECTCETDDVEPREDCPQHGKQSGGEIKGYCKEPGCDGH